jgi:hypothetical protein
MKIKKLWVIGSALFFLAGLSWGQSIHFTTSVPTSGPNAIWCKGKAYAISWTSQGHSELIRISLHRGGAEVVLIGSNLASNGSLSWTVPASLATACDYYLNFRTMAGHYGFSTGPLCIQTCLQQATTPQVVVKPDLAVSQTPPIHAIAYEQFEQGAIRMEPAALTVRWGTHSLVINQGEEKWISIDEDSELIDPATHGLRATVEYTLRNTMAKNFRFHVALRFGGHSYAPLQLNLIGVGSQHFTQDVVLYPGNQTLPISVIATDILVDGGSNDVPPGYFSGKLHVRIYPN